MKTEKTILIVTSRPKQLADFSQALAADGRLRIIFSATAKETLDEAARNRPVLVIVDGQAGEGAGLDLVKSLLGVDAFIHSAFISHLPDEEFHRRSEGLGILAQLPGTPDTQDALRLIDKLQQAGALPGSTANR